MSITVSVDQSSINKTEQVLRQAFDKVIQNKKLLEEIGETVRRDVVVQTRSGNSIHDDSKLKPLKPGTVKQRLFLSNKINTHELFKVKRSNLTLSGQLLDSLKARVSGKGQVELNFEGDHKPYRTISEKTNEPLNVKPLKNKDLARYVSKDRPFLGVRDQIQIRIKRTVIEYVRRSSKVFSNF